MNAQSLGALAENVKTIPELEAALKRARAADRTYVICIDTDPARTTDEGGVVGSGGARSVGPRRSRTRRAQQYEADKQRQQP